MDTHDKVLLTGVLTALVALSLWLQYGLLEPVQETVEPRQTRHAPDYFIENFTATGIDKKGQKFVLKADRMVHFADDETSLLDNPHIVQHLSATEERHSYAHSGWVSADGSEILLTEKVRVFQIGPEKSTSHVSTSDKMKISL